jgi:SAM-dependent methyltransferase
MRCEVREPSVAATARKRYIETREQPCNACSANAPQVIARGVDFEYDTCANEFCFVRCGSCGHLYLNPMPEPYELGVIYPPTYGNYEGGRDAALTFKVKNWLDRRYIRKLTEGMSVDRILDVGCADGRMLDLCRRAFPNASCIEGVEFSPEAAQNARRRGYTVHVGNIDDLELKEDHYDLVFLQQVIEHVFDPTAVIHKLHRAVRDGGRVCFETPTSEAIDRRFGEKRYWGGYHFPRHFNIFDERNFGAICERAGFAVLGVAYRFQPVHWVWTVHHWLKEKGAPPALYDLFNIKNSFMIAIGTVCEALSKMLSGRASNMQVLVEKRPRG